jgi:hypothetical protein
MRKAFDRQQRMDCQPIARLQLNFNCRDEIIPILAALKHIYLLPTLRNEILCAVARDVNRDSSPKRGREGMDYWPILVLAAVRLGCNFNYDRLQDLAEQHRTLRQMMGVGEWDEESDFNWRTIRNNIALLRPETIERINHAIVAEGHKFVPEAAETRILQKRLEGRIRQASFDRGFHSPENQRDLAEILAHSCLPMPGAVQSRQQEAEATIEFRQARQRHSGIESAINALQAGNGLGRCRDRSERGFSRYLQLAVLGRNLHVLGKILIAREDAECHAAESRRKSTAA